MYLRVVGAARHRAVASSPAAVETGHERPQRGSEPSQLLEVEATELLEARRSLSGQVQANDAEIVGVRDPRHEARGLGPIHQLDRAVVTQQERIRDVADRRSSITAMTTHHEQQLVLRGGEPRGRGLLLAPSEEATQLGPELQQALIVNVRPGASHIRMLARRAGQTLLG
jgi:hypothetical protein